MDTKYHKAADLANGRIRQHKRGSGAPMRAPDSFSGPQQQAK